MRRFNETETKSNYQQVALLQWLSAIAYHGLANADQWLHESAQLPMREAITPIVNPNLIGVSALSSPKAPNIFIPIPANHKHGIYVLFKPYGKELTIKQYLCNKALLDAGYDLLLVQDVYAASDLIKDKLKGLIV